MVGCQGSVGLLYFSSLFFLIASFLLFATEFQEKERMGRGGKGLERLQNMF
jgi:hypothetical protein